MEEYDVVWEAAGAVVVAWPEEVAVAGRVAADEGETVVAVGGVASSPLSPSSDLGPPRPQASLDLPSPLGPSSYGARASHRFGRPSLPDC